MPLTPPGLLARLYALPKELAQAAEGLLSPAEQELLFREPGTGWSSADVPLLDEAAELIGPDVTIAAEQARERAQAAADRAVSLDHARSVLDANPEAGAIVTAEMLADRFTTGGDSLTVADRARQDRDWAFGHVVVDEAQEASPMLWRLLARRVPSRSMTVVGDLAQTSSAAGASSWAQMLAPIAQDRWQVQELTVNYRTPGVIMDPAVTMLRASGMTDVLEPRSAREGDWPPTALRVASQNPDDVAGGILAALAADDRALDGGQLAVILPRALRASLADRLVHAITNGEAGSLTPARVSVLDVQQAKGLEFDAVVVAGPAAILAESPRGANDLYVALTRPTQRLTVVHARELPEGLTSLARHDDEL
jgi:superfamily I DNA/RNA helicase